MKCLLEVSAQWKKKILICVSVIKGLNQPKATGREISVSADRTMLPDANLLAERKLLGDMKSIKSLKQSGLSGVFTGQAVSALSSLILYIFPWHAPPPFAKICICAEQDGGPAHRGGQPVGHRLPGAHSR